MPVPEPALRASGTRRVLLAMSLVLLAAISIWVFLLRPGLVGYDLIGRGSLPGHPVAARRAMVVSADTLASRIGRDVLRDGGNAVDAAIATGFALAVTYPAAGNIGGGGFMVIRFPDGQATTFDFRERAPAAAHPNMFLDEQGRYANRLHHNSHLAVGVPGTVAGLARAHAAYGLLPWDRLVEPAIALARDGFPLTRALASTMASALRSMQPYPASVAAFSDRGRAREPGEIWRQPELAHTLERIRDQGHAGFYQGETARLIAEEMRRGGGLITEKDLADYQAVEREALTGSFRDYRLIGMPPPSSGGTVVLQMLAVLEGYDLAAMGHNSPRYLHHLTEAMRRGFLDRARHLADPEYMTISAYDLISPSYAAAVRASIDPQRAGVSSPLDVELPVESLETTHFSIVDRRGMAVAMTYTLEASWGSKITVPGAGFLLNNEMGDFNGRPGLTTERGLIGTEPNLARPGQRMLSSMSPMIVERDGALVGIVGSPGGRTIINTVLQVLLNLLEFDMNIQQAVDAPRIHHQWLPDVLRIERAGADEALLEALRGMGHTVEVGGNQGRAHSLVLDPRTRIRLGAADPREPDGAAMGY